MTGASNLFSSGKTSHNFVLGENVNAGDSLVLSANGQVFKTPAGRPLNGDLLADLRLFPSYTGKGAICFHEATNKLIYAYTNGTNIFIKTGAVNPNTGDITWSTELATGIAWGTAPLGSKLIEVGASTAVLLYRSATNTLSALAIDVSGANPTVGSAVSVATNVSNTATGNTSFGINKHSGTVAVAVYARSDSPSLQTRVLTLTGTSISVGAANNIVASGSTNDRGRIRGLSVDTISGQHIIYYSTDSAGSSSYEACLGTVSGTTMAFGSVLGVGTDNGQTATTEDTGFYHDVSNNNCFFGYRKGGSTDTAILCRGITGTAFSGAGAEYLYYGTDANGRFSVEPISSGLYLFLGQSGGSQSCLVTVSSTTITEVNGQNGFGFPSSTVLSNASWRLNVSGDLIYRNSLLQDATRIGQRQLKSFSQNYYDIVSSFGFGSYQSYSKNYIVKNGAVNTPILVVVNNTFGTTVQFSVLYVYGNRVLPNPLPVGIAAESGTTGQTKKVNLSSMYSGYTTQVASGLIPGQAYHVSPNGGLGLSGSQREYVGMALSSTLLSLNDNGALGLL